MIKVTINRNSTGRIDSFTMSGHAEYDVPGKDIVCAGASAVAFGTINSIYALCKVEPILEQEKMVSSAVRFLLLRMRQLRKKYNFF